MTFSQNLQLQTIRETKHKIVLFITALFRNRPDTAILPNIWKMLQKPFGPCRTRKIKSLLEWSKESKGTNTRTLLLPFHLLLSLKRTVEHEETAAISIPFCTCFAFQTSVVIMWVTLCLPGRGECLHVSEEGFSS